MKTRGDMQHLQRILRVLFFISLNMMALAKSVGKGEQQFKTALLSYPVAGGLSYVMSLEEINHTIESKFRKMRKERRILTRPEFDKYKRDEWFHKPGSNLTRIWGAEYLAEKFKKKPHFKVPDYIIVVEDLKNLNIRVCWGKCFPIISKVRGDIYARKIDGKPSQPDVGFGFDDYTGPNVLKTDDGTYYVIDTEYRSFYKAAPEKEIYKQVKDWPRLCESLKNRFMVSNKIKGVCRTFNLSVAAD